MICVVLLPIFLKSCERWRISWVTGLGVPDFYSTFPYSFVAEAWNYSCGILTPIAALDKIVCSISYRYSTRSSFCLRRLGHIANENKKILKCEVESKFRPVNGDWHIYVFYDFLRCYTMPHRQRFKKKKNQDAVIAKKHFINLI